MQIVFLGLNSAGQKVYDWLNDREGVEVRALLTEKDQLDLIKVLEPDIVVSCGFEYKVPEEIINVPEKGVVNLHPSFLPHNRGSNPYVWPILDGSPAGVSIHYMSERIDEGDIIAKKEVRVSPDDTAKTLYERLQNEQFELFKQNWDVIKTGNPEVEVQDRRDGSKHYEREVDKLCKLDLNEEAALGDFIDRLRALTFPPHKTGYFELYGEKYYVEIDITKEK